MAGQNGTNRRTINARRKKVHHSIKALVAAYGRRGESPEEIIRRRARELVAWAKANRWVGPPFCPKELAGLLGIDVRASSEDSFAQGCIFADRDDSLILMYDDRLPEERQLFSIFHEIAHTIFPDFAKVVQYRFKEEAYDHQKAQFEQLCNIAAGELMLPHANFIAACKEVPFGMCSMNSLRPLFKASLEAILYRLIDTTNRSCAVAFLAPGIKKVRKNAKVKPEDSEIKWRIDYWIKTPCFKESITKGWSVPDNSIIHSCELGEFLTANETWHLTKKLRLTIDATSIPPKPMQPERAAAIITLQ